MPQAIAILTGQYRTRKLAVEALSELGEVDVSTLTATYMPGVEIEGTYYDIPATRYTAEVEPKDGISQTKGRG